MLQFIPDWEAAFRVGVSTQFREAKRPSKLHQGLFLALSSLRTGGGDEEDSFELLSSLFPAPQVVHKTQLNAKPQIFIQEH